MNRGLLFVFFFFLFVGSSRVKTVLGSDLLSSTGLLLCLNKFIGRSRAKLLLKNLGTSREKGVSTAVNFLLEGV